MVSTQIALTPCQAAASSKSLWESFGMQHAKQVCRALQRHLGRCVLEHVGRRAQISQGELINEMGISQNLGYLLGVPIKRTIVFWGLYWGSLILRKLPNCDAAHSSLGSTEALRRPGLDTQTQRVLSTHMGNSYPNG